MAKQIILAILHEPYWKFRGDFSLHGNLLLYQDRVTILQKLQEQILHKLHQGHQGIQRCRLRAKSSVWWLNISRDINNFIQQCPECMKMLTPPREPLITSPLPSHSWEKVASDLFHLNNSTYLIVVNYFSRYPEVVQLSSTAPLGVIKALQAIFSSHEVPSTFMSDNGPQFSSKEMKEFANTYGFTLITSNPHYTQK